MPPNKFAPAANRLIASLPSKDRQRFLAACEPGDLVLAEILAEPGEPIRHVYFPTESIISLVAQIDGSGGLEVGLVGDEGMFGVSLILGVDVSPLHALVQAPGPVLRMDAAAFCRELAQSIALQRVLNRYLYVLMGQLAQSAACTRFHVVEARLARWLLMTQDRAHSEKFHITHEFMAHMLGVRRVGITKAATALHDRQLIRYSRGNITILDRAGLEAASCRCYAADRASYDRIMSLRKGLVINRLAPGFPVQQVAMQKPAQNKPEHQGEKYQHCGRHRNVPDQKADLDDSHVLGDEYHRQA